MASRETILSVLQNLKARFTELILRTVQLFLTDNETKFSQSIGWAKGERTGRYAIIVDHGKVVYAETELGGGLTVSP